MENFYEVFFATWVTYEVLEFFMASRDLVKKEDADPMAIWALRLIGMLLVFLLTAGVYWVLHNLKNF